MMDHVTAAKSEATTIGAHQNKTWVEYQKHYTWHYDICHYS